jgi:hypothetical protein
MSKKSDKKKSLKAPSFRASGKFKVCKHICAQGLNVQL